MNVDYLSPTAYAKHLAGYMADPSKVYALTSRSYSRNVPTLEQCAEWIAKRQADAIKPLDRPRDLNFGRCGHPKAGNTVITIDGNEICKQCEDKRAAAVKLRAEHDRARVAMFAAKASEKTAKRRKLIALHRAKNTDKADNTAALVRVHSDFVADIAARFGFTLAEIKGSSRQQMYVDARAVIAMALKARGNSYPQCARYMGRICHSTIINLCDTFPARAAKHPHLQAILNEVLA